MKTTRNSPRARAEKATARRFLRLHRLTERELPIGRLDPRWERIFKQTKQLHVLRYRLAKFAETGFITKEGFKAWDAL